MECDRCSLPLVKVEDSDKYGHRHNDLPQYRDALIIDFVGAYGMFIEPIDGNPRVIICQNCAQSLLNDNPWLNKIVFPDYNNPCVGDPAHMYHSHDDDPAVDYRVYEGDNQQEIKGY